MQIFWDISPALPIMNESLSATETTGEAAYRRTLLQGTILLTQSRDNANYLNGFQSDATRESIMEWASEENGNGGRYIGRCRVIDVRGTMRIIRPEHLAGYLFGKVTRVLIRTHSDIKGHTVLSAEAIKLLASCGVKLLGIDTSSVDAPTSPSKESYKAILQYGIALLPNLNLKDVTGGDYEMLALPIEQAKKAGSLKDLEMQHAKSSTTRAA